MSHSLPRGFCFWVTFALASMDGVADSANVSSCLVGARQQLKQWWRCAARAIRGADTMPSTLAAQMLAQQFTGAWTGRAQVPSGRLATDSYRRLDPTPRPTQASPRDHLFLLRFFQDITPANKG